MPQIIDLSGQRFGKLIVLCFLFRRNKHSVFKCLCDCGKETEVLSNNLRRKHTTSCGCESEKNKIVFVENGIKHGLRSHPLYESWIGMRNRCYYKKHNRYRNYGGKGIKVCEEWQNNFMAFYNWAINNGWKEGLSIDRIKNHLDYCPENCKFSTNPEQSRNRTSNVSLTIDGVTKILIEWAEYANVNYGTLRGRLKLGWAPKDAVFGKNH